MRGFVQNSVYMVVYKRSDLSSICKNSGRFKFLFVTSSLVRLRFFAWSFGVHRSKSLAQKFSRTKWNFWFCLFVPTVKFRLSVQWKEDFFGSRSKADVNRSLWTFFISLETTVRLLGCNWSGMFVSGGDWLSAELSSLYWRFVVLPFLELFHQQCHAVTVCISIVQKLRWVCNRLVPLALLF